MRPGEAVAYGLEQLAYRWSNGIDEALNSDDRARQQAAIRELAREAGSQAALARALGMDRRNIGLWLAGEGARQRRSPSAANRERLQDFARSRAGQRTARELHQRPIAAFQRMQVAYQGRSQGERRKTVVLDPSDAAIRDAVVQLTASWAAGDELGMGRAFEDAFSRAYGLPGNLEVTDVLDLRFDWGET